MRRTRRRKSRNSKDANGKPSRFFRIARTLTVVLVLASMAFFGYGFLNGAEAVMISVVANGEPIEGAVVITGSAEYVTGADGTVEVSIRLPAEIEATASGFHRAIKTIESADPDAARVALSPIVVFGLVTDPDGKGIPGVLIKSGEQVTTTDADGAFELGSAQPGLVEIGRPGWATVEVALQEGQRSLDAVLEPFVVRGMRVSPAAAGDAERYATLLGLADDSVVNTLVFDTKNEKGAIRYESQVSGAAMLIVYNVERVLSQAKELGLYTITRIVTFQDAPRARNFPETACESFKLPSNRPGSAWLTGELHSWQMLMRIWIVVRML